MLEERRPRPKRLAARHPPDRSAFRRRCLKLAYASAIAGVLSVPAWYAALAILAPIHDRRDDLYWAVYGYGTLAATLVGLLALILAALAEPGWPRFLRVVGFVAISVLGTAWVAGRMAPFFSLYPFF